MDIFDLFGLLALWIRCDPRRSSKAADFAWSPLALLGLFVFGLLTVAWCVATPRR